MGPQLFRWVMTMSKGEQGGQKFLGEHSAAVLLWLLQPGKATGCPNQKSECPVGPGCFPARVPLLLSLSFGFFLCSGSGQLAGKIGSRAEGSVGLSLCNMLQTLAA